jgi:dTDP-4-dehydrorhamnose 3,5-epimerase
MEITPLRLRGTFQITTNPLHDGRGYFMRVWDEKIFRASGMTTAWVQENQSFNHRKGIIRGLHFQTPPHAETKLVRVAAGAIFDVFVDLRKDSETYEQWDALELSADNYRMVYIPKGFAHGYCTLADKTVVIYKVDEYYAPDFAGGLKWDDKTLNITWPGGPHIVSPQDREQPLFDNFASPF